jgi:hypothetical protein
MKREGATEEANRASEAQAKAHAKKKGNRHETEASRQPISDPCHLDLVQVTQASDQSEYQSTKG